MMLIAAFKKIIFVCFSIWIGLYIQPVYAEQNAGNSSNKIRPFVWAHRGGTLWAPENTLAAFSKSLEAHVDGIELDIHRLKTGELVVIHDENLKRTTNGNGLVGETSLKDISKLSAGAWFSPEFKEERIPLLSQVLSLVNGKAILNIEIKNIPIDYPGIEDALLKELATYKHPDKIVISSFDHQVLERLHKKAPKYTLALLNEGMLANLGNYAKSVGAKLWNPGFGSIRADYVTYAHKSGLKVNVWTVNGVGNWRKAISMKVDGIITDDPKGLIDFLNKDAY